MGPAQSEADRRLRGVSLAQTEMPRSVGKMGTPDGVAQRVLFLDSDASDPITVTEISIDGAESL